jgi:CxxC-x17-CxxC domain-containing protein
MEQHRDEHIVCADCGEAFVFTAVEAAVFAERGLTSPKRCRGCRKARKEHAPAQDRGGNGRARPGAPFAGSRRGPAPQPRYTGDVNEYRSPMQDSYPEATGHAGRRGPSRVQQGGYLNFRGHGSVAGGGAGGNSTPHGYGNSTAVHGRQRALRQDHKSRGPAAHEGSAGNHIEGRGRAAAPISSAQRRPQPEMFSITCNACGKNAEVPFRPEEGRDVFCQTCYRARKPA